MLLQKHVPTQLLNFTGNTHVAKILLSYTSELEKHNSFVFRGPVNTGKTLASRSFLQHFTATHPSYTGHYYSAVDPGSMRSAVLHAQDPLSLVVLDDFDFLTEQDKEIFLKKTENNTNTVVCLNFLTPSQLLPSNYLMLDFAYFQEQALFDYVYDVCRAENLSVTDDALYKIVKKSGGDVSKCFVYLDQLLNAAAPADNLLSSKHFDTLTLIFSSLQEHFKLAEAVDYLATYLSVEYLYVLLAEYAMNAYLDVDYAPVIRTLHGKKLIAYAKELYTLSKSSLTKAELVCDLILLDSSISGNKLYKSTVDNTLLDATTTSRVKMQRSLIKNFSKSTGKEYSAFDLANRLGGTCRRQTG